MTRLDRVARLSPQDVALLATAWMLVARARLALWLLPWDRIIADPEVRPADGLSQHHAERRAWAVRAASRLVPRATCLTQALALCGWLQREGCRSIVQIGVANENGRFSAHAWVEYGGIPLLTTRREIDRYARCLTLPRAHA